jgi:4-aminobutyrate aminotransferase-like enzyme
MATQERSATAAVVEARERYVAVGVATPPLVVARAEGARVEDVDRPRYIDFAEASAVNTGHNPPGRRDPRAGRSLPSPVLHGRNVRAVRRGLPATRGALALQGRRPEDDPPELGAEAVENAVKIARVATGRQAVVVFDRAFHGRTLLAMTMTSKVVPYKRGFGPFAPEVYRAPAPYPYRGVTTDDAIQARGALQVRCGSPGGRLAARACPGEAGSPPRDYPLRLRSCATVTILRRRRGAERRRPTGPVAIEHYGVEPDLLVSGKSLGGGLPLAAVTGRSEVVDSVGPGGLGGTFGEPCLRGCAAVLMRS